MQDRNNADPKAYNPTFQWGFLAPKHWGTWLAIVAFLPLALLPVRAQSWLAKRIAAKLAKSHKGPAHRARVNFELCFPEKSFQQREELIEKTLYVATFFSLRFALLSLRSAKWLKKHCHIQGLEILQHHLEQGDKIIVLTPHSWAIDIPGILFSALDMPMVGFVKEQKHPVSNWLMNKQRIQNGAKVYERSAGIKPYLKAIREGYIGYYLPDQDHGKNSSVFVDFFSTRKATLTGLSKLARLSKAKVIPLFTSIDDKTGDFHIQILPELHLSQNEEDDARLMNQTIEHFISPQLEQYMWVLQLLYTQEDGINYYNHFKPRYKSDWKI